MTGEAVRKRRREFMERPEAINQFGQCMQLAQKAVDSFKAGDEKFNHLDAAEVEKVQKAIAEKQDWFSRMCADVSKLVSLCFCMMAHCIQCTGPMPIDILWPNFTQCVILRTRPQTPQCWLLSSTRRRSRSGTWPVTFSTNPSLR